jgi:hypothetical protein
MLVRANFSALLLAGMQASSSAQTPDLAKVLADCRAQVATLRETLAIGTKAYVAQRFERKDLRYLAVNGIGSFVPGVKDQVCIYEGNYSVWLEGTSDALCANDHSELNSRAYAFASEFNRAMGKFRKNAGLPTCNDDG